MRVEDCVFRGHALPGLLIAPDAESWHEFGPSEHVLVADCLFEKCAMNGSRANAGAVSVKTSDDCGAGRRLSGVHKDVRILGNTFRRCGTRGVFVSAADGVVVRDNVFEDNRIPHDDAPGLADVRLENCTDCAQEASALQRIGGDFGRVEGPVVSRADGFSAEAYGCRVETKVVSNACWLDRFRAR